jgi:ribosomal protein L11 methyltransferase
MDYIELSIPLAKLPVDPDLLTALLSLHGFDSFVEEGEVYKAYIVISSFNESVTRELLGRQGVETGFEFNRINDRNWNELWESQFNPVVIGGRCLVRAPFHPREPQYPLELIIEPRMSFGTAHHETTSLMMEWLLDFPPVGQAVLDMGSGTGILAILSAKLGADAVTAVDNDEWAYSNASDNVRINGTPGIRVLMGDAGALKGLGTFGIILANINRNILLADIPAYAAVLEIGGILYLSGFYLPDLAIISDVAKANGLVYVRYLERNNWVAARFEKKT